MVSILHIPGRPAPINTEDRYAALDVIRGVALSGVLLVNLLDCFRVSLFERILNFHTHPGTANRIADLIVAFLLEFKAFTLFSFMFGVGVGVQYERIRHNGFRDLKFLSRRFLALLLIGTIHMFLIWNGDILMLYAVCGLLLLPFVRLSSRTLVFIGFALLLITPYLPFFGAFLPPEDAMHAQAALATHVYSAGTFAEIARLRIEEAVHFIFPLLLDSLPRTFALMLLGIATWRTGVFKSPGKFRLLLLVGTSVGLVIGGVTTAIQLWARETGHHAPSQLSWLYPYSVVILALAYGSVLLYLSRPETNSSASWLIRKLASAGRMALSNYLAQSLVFSFVFYSFGFGLMGRLGSAITLLFGLGVFIAQVFISELWLKYYRFGPVEWLWRTLTYGYRQPFSKR